MGMSVVYWLTALASVIAVFLNIQKRVAAFYIWTATNAVWAYADVVHGLLPQAVIQSVYFGLSVYGIAKWRNDGEEAAT